MILKRDLNQIVQCFCCPVGINLPGDNPGKLKIVFDGYWLFCENSKYKYPVIDGIPVLLVEVGKRWSTVDLNELPVPPTKDNLIEI